MGDPWGIVFFWGGEKPNIKQIVKKIGEKNLKNRRNRGKNRKNLILFRLG